MRCKSIRPLLIVQGSSLPSCVVEHLAHCEQCRCFHEQNARLRGLLALKKYETPPPGSEERMVRAVHNALAEQWSKGASPAGRRFWDLFVLEPLPALRYAAAALLLFLVSIQMLNMPKLDPLGSPATELLVVETITPRESYAAESTSLDTKESLLISPAFQAISNRGSGFMEYGPLQSVPVRFDF